MKYVEVIAESGSVPVVRTIAEKYKAEDFRLGLVGDDGMQPMRLVVADDMLQSVLDALQSILGAQATAQILVMPIEASLPKPEEKERSAEDKATAAREALYEEVEKSSRLNANFIVLVMLSTVVAAIGLVEDNIAVVIGAMVIAPLLGPNLALSLGTALGDIPLMRKSVYTLLVGILLVLVLSAALGFAWPSPLSSHELMLRTEPTLESVVLALASGAAAALSLTTGLSSVLVGVMVAVALLPPAVTCGLMLGHGGLGLATGAGLLLAVNVVCVNLASKVVFLIKGIHPRTWVEKEKAKHATVVYVLVWVVTLLILLAAIYARSLR
jgi:uncharacterized hydrophobic protein (TIGR00341 family)